MEGLRRTKDTLSYRRKGRDGNPDQGVVPVRATLADLQADVDALWARAGRGPAVEILSEHARHATQWHLETSPAGSAPRSGRLGAGSARARRARLLALEPEGSVLVGADELDPPPRHRPLLATRLARSRCLA